MFGNLAQVGTDIAVGTRDLASDAFDSAKDVIRDPFGRDHATEEAEKAREHSTLERLGAQEFNSAEALAARDFNASEAEKARQHSEYLSRTEYSRKMQSMRDAGLNPVLAAGGWGSGSQVPSSAQAQGSAAHSSPGSSPSAGGAMAPLQALLLAAQIRDISSASKLKDEQTRDLAITRDPRVNEITARTEKIGSEISQISASIEEKKALTKNINKQFEILEQQLTSAKSKAEVDKAVAEFQIGAGGAIQRWSDAIGLKGRDVTHLIGAVIGLAKFGAMAKAFGRGKNKQDYNRTLQAGEGQSFELRIPEP